MTRPFGLVNVLPAAAKPCSLAGGEFFNAFLILLVQLLPVSPSGYSGAGFLWMRTTFLPRLARSRPLAGGNVPPL